MKKVYFQKGPITNSSSAHCLVYFKKPNIINNDTYFDPENLGWNDFIFSSKENKIKYILANLCCYSIIANIIKKNAHKIKEELDVKIRKEDIVLGSEYELVDHQSIFELEFINKQADIKWVLRFIKLLLDDHWVIFGGNDNGGYWEGWIDNYGYNYNDLKDKIKINIPTGYKIITYHDDKFTIFKISDMTFIITDGNDEINNAQDVAKYIIDNRLSVPPILLDIKLTDKCNVGCKYCYQKSNPNGKHGDLKYLYKLIDDKRFDMTHFVLGGGDIFELKTDYLKDIKNTTSEFNSNKSYGITIRPHNLEKAFQYFYHHNIKHIGISIDNIKDFIYVIKFIYNFASNISSKSKWYEPAEIFEKIIEEKINFHYIAELNDMDKFIEILDKYLNVGRLLNIPIENIKFNFLLLGPKNIEEDKLIEWDYEKLFKKMEQLVEEEKINHFTIDTALSRRLKNKNLLDKLFITDDKVYFHEGVLSKYVDLVEKYVAPSSYCKDKSKRRYFNNYDELVDLILDSSISELE